LDDPQIQVFALTGNPDLLNYDNLNNAGIDGFDFRPKTLGTTENILLAIADGSTECAASRRQVDFRYIKGLKNGGIG
jgi:hypothetical protein